MSKFQHKYTFKKIEPRRYKITKYISNMQRNGGSNKNLVITNDFTVEFSQNFWDNPVPLFIKLFHEIKKEKFCVKTNFTHFVILPENDMWPKAPGPRET